MLFTFCKHSVDQARQLLRGGGYGFRFVHAPAHLAEIRAQRRLTAAQCYCGQSQGLGCLVDYALDLTAHHFAASNLEAGA